MPKTTLICLWCLRKKNYNIITEGLNINLKNAVIKILIFISIEIKNSNKVLRIMPNELSMDFEIISASIEWLCKSEIIVKINKENFETEGYLIRYTDQEKELRLLYQDCWVELPNQKIMSFIKKTPNDQDITFEAISRYLKMIQSYEFKIQKYKQLIFDEGYVAGHFHGTWRELLVQYDLVEFLDIGYLDVF
ncbi:MAG: hypothetical protein GAK29_00663 [Acinetobacter bereziniae]|uniref:Uncharacterized protein n=1 Tax=Acinetobacter bereziniae TaxID=106648 RepID=A0A833PH44_ACIBZ|nr:MAG: hypothetical protein GAK29_00663 [Acinetobacter bereziniae]